MKKNTKSKKQKQQKKYFGEEIYFEGVLMILLIPTLVFLLAPVFNKADKFYKKTYLRDNGSVKISTDKRIYNLGDKIVLTIKNNLDESVYFEPCEYLNNFEKKVDEIWEPADDAATDKVYDMSGFDRKKKVTECEIEFPKSGQGMHRLVVQIYYGCEKPGKNMCEKAETFYSNEFEIE